MTGPFRQRTLWIVIGVVVTSLIVTAVLSVFGDELGETRSAGANGYSTSAIGHRGLAELLEELDIPVIVSRSDSASKAASGLLILAEPVVTDYVSRARFERLVTSAPRTLVVLPKWYGQIERGKLWLEDASFIPEDEVAAIFASLGIDATLVRAAAPVAWSSELSTSTPRIREPQLARTEDLARIIEAPDGAMLLGTDEDGLWVLTDPDVLNNFGLREPANAQLVVQLVDQLREGGPVVIDETLHGYVQQPSLVRTLFRFPLVLAMLQVLVCAVLAVWAAMVRFGPPRSTAPPIAPGKDFLIRNTAALLRFCGHHPHALRRYLQLAIAEVRHKLHAPTLAPAAMTHWLEQVRQRRGGTISLVELEQEVATARSPERVVEVADRIYRWRMEMMGDRNHGTDSRS